MQLGALLPTHFTGKRFLKNEAESPSIVWLFLGRWEQMFIHPHRALGTDQKKISPESSLVSQGFHRDSFQKPG